MPVKKKKVMEEIQAAMREVIEKAIGLVKDACLKDSGISEEVEISLDDEDDKALSEYDRPEDFKKPKLESKTAAATNEVCIT